MNKLKALYNHHSSTAQKDKKSKKSAFLFVIIAHLKKRYKNMILFIKYAITYALKNNIDISLNWIERTTAAAAIVFLICITIKNITDMWRDLNE